MDESLGTGCHSRKDVDEAQIASTEKFRDRLRCNLLLYSQALTAQSGTSERWIIHLPVR
jgi:hypothetical protein